MKTLDDIKDVLNTVIESISVHPGVKKILLFGSYARGEANIQSDVDIAIVHLDSVPASFSKELKRRFYSLYDGDIEVQFTYLSESAFIGDEHILNVARSVREEGVCLWPK